MYRPHNIPIFLILFLFSQIFALEHFEVALKDVDTGAGIEGKDVHMYHLNDPSLYDQIKTTDADGMAVFENLFSYVEKDGTLVPINYEVSQNYPNPFNPGTVIPFSIYKAGEVDIHIYNILGAEVRHLVSKWLPAGKYEVYWSGTKNDGGGVSAGIYFMQMVTGDEVHTIKMTLMDGNVTAVNSADGDINTLENHSFGYKSKKAGENGEPYVIEVDADDNYLGLADTVYVNESTGRLTYDLVPVAVNNPPSINLDDTSTLEDELPGVVYDLHSQTTDESPDSMLTYEILNESNPELVSFEIDENRYLKMKSLKGNSSGSSEVTIRVTDPDGLYTDVTFVQDVLPQADIVGTLKDPVTKDYADNVSGTVNGMTFTSDDSGRVSMQVPPGAYTFKTDTTGGRMQTYWDLGDVGTEDVNLDTLLNGTPLKAVPVAYKNDEQMALVINAHGVYGAKSDRRTQDQNKTWDAEKVYGEGLEKGTLRTVYVNTSNIEPYQLAQDNLDWAVGKVPEAMDNLIRLQARSDADSVYIEANNATEESQIFLQFIRGEILQDYDFMVQISDYSPSINGSDANYVPDGEHAGKGFARINVGNLGDAQRGGALSELVSAVVCAEDVTEDMEDAAAGTLFGKPGEMNHQDGYNNTVKYGPDQVVMSPEKHLGALTLNIPLDTMIRQYQLELPKPGQ